MLQIGDIVKWTDGIDTYGIVVAKRNGYVTITWFDDEVCNEYASYTHVSFAKVS